jgi:hypothetical protein
MAAVGVVAVCLFTLWPLWLRIGVWYLAVTLLLLIMGTTLLQLLVVGLSWLVGWELWIIPNLWADVMPWEIHRPLYTLKRSEGGSVWLRIVGIVVVLALAGFVYTQAPGEARRVPPGGGGGCTGRVHL